MLEVAPGSPGLFVRFAEVQNRMAGEQLVGDYLTTKGQAPEADYRMIEEMGFVITRGAEAAEPAPALLLRGGRQEAGAAAQAAPGRAASAAHHLDFLPGAAAALRTFSISD